MRYILINVTPDTRYRWFHHRRNVLHTLELPLLYDAEIWAYLDSAAHAMVNTIEEQLLVKRELIICVSLTIDFFRRCEHAEANALRDSQRSSDNRPVSPAIS